MRDFRYSVCRAKSFPYKWQLLCLLMIGAMEFAMMIIGTMYNYIAFALLHRFALIPCVLFLLVTAIENHGQRSRYPLGAAAAMAVWFLIVELQHRANQLDSHTMGLFFSVYLVAFPFAVITRDWDRQNGIKIMAAIFLATSLIYVTETILLMLNSVPQFLREDVFWDGARLNIIHHPNISSRILLMGMVFALYIAMQQIPKWLKAILLAAAMLMFSAIALTNSRAIILLACLLLAGTVFFKIFKGGWKQFFVGAAVGLVVLGATFLLSQELYQRNEERLFNEIKAQQILELQKAAEERVLTSSDTISPEQIQAEANEIAKNMMIPVNGQGSLLQDMQTLNFRTTIWSTALQRIQENPSVLLWGTDSSDKVLSPLPSEHTHNAWLEVLVRLGIPGLLLSLVFTAQALWSIACLLWYPQVSLDKKLISMLVLCVLVSGILEPFMFLGIDSWHFIDFSFFLCLGYLIQWRKRIHVQEPQNQERNPA